MDTNVFISKIQINQIKKSKSSIELQQMSIGFYDKDGEESSFLTSIMSTDKMDNYQQNLLGALNSTNWIQAIHGAVLTNLTTIKDEEDQTHLIGFESPFGLILKNEVKLYNSNPELTPTLK
ncbi:MAG: hypothetical protein IJB10_03965 [Clostridia bacterium]|nr:hypothetical protein [Clostridia bacterium]